jgi:hypothetical protein
VVDGIGGNFGDDEVEEPLGCGGEADAVCAETGWEDLCSVSCLQTEKGKGKMGIPR